MARVSFSRFDLPTALESVGLRELQPWALSPPLKPPSDFFQEKMRRLRRFDTARSEGAKLLVVDALFEEAIQPYEQLRIFKETTIHGETSGGLVDYLVSRSGMVPTSPFLCVSEAKKDDFDKGLAQCLVEMQACAEINGKHGLSIPIFGIVTNGAGWQFYRREVSGMVLESVPYSVTQVQEILGILNLIFAECEKNLL
jgi:hypothetical protein